MSLPVMADKLKEAAARKIKNLSEEEKKALAESAKKTTEEETGVAPLVASVGEAIKAVAPEAPQSTPTVAQENPEDETTKVRNKVKDLSNLGLIGADELYKQLPQLSSQLQYAVGKKAEDIRGGVTGGNLAAGLTRSVDDIVNKIKSKNMTEGRQVLDSKAFLLSDPKTKDIIGHPAFEQMYPNFWQVVMKKAGVRQ